MRPVAQILRPFLRTVLTIPFQIILELLQALIQIGLAAKPFFDGGQVIDQSWSVVSLSSSSGSPTATDASNTRRASSSIMSGAMPFTRSFQSG